MMETSWEESSPKFRSSTTWLRQKYGISYAMYVSNRNQDSVGAKSLTRSKNSP